MSHNNTQGLIYVLQLDFCAHTTPHFAPQPSGLKQAKFHYLHKMRQSLVTNKHRRPGKVS